MSRGNPFRSRQPRVRGPDASRPIRGSRMTAPRPPEDMRRPYSGRELMEAGGRPSGEKIIMPDGRVFTPRPLDAIAPLRSTPAPQLPPAAPGERPAAQPDKPRGLMERAKAVIVDTKETFTS